MNTKQASNPVKPSDLYDLAQAAVLADCFLFVEGRGGAGKTEIIRDLASQLGRQLWYVNLNGFATTECIGYGSPQSNGEMDFYAPSIWPTRKRVGGEPVLLFLDELNDYDPAVRALLRSLFPSAGARYVGPHKLGTDVLVVCASNRRCDGTAAKTEEAPFTERCIKCTLEPDLSDWLAYYDSKPELVASGSHVPSFLRYGSTTGDGLDHFCPPLVLPYDGEPHPCPRTWTAVAKLEPVRKSNSTIYRKAVRGLVGANATNALIGFLQHVDKLPNIEELRANPDAFVVPEDPAAQFALVSACLTTATKGIKDIGAAVHSGGFDWLISLLLRCRGDIREFGARSADRRGIPLKQHAQSRSLFCD
jgi:hypothetical protein